jgi:hypothetical protein
MLYLYSLLNLSSVSWLKPRRQYTSASSNGKPRALNLHVSRRSLVNLPTYLQEQPKLQPGKVLQMMVPLQPVPKIVLASREMLDRQSIHHVRRHFRAIRIIVSISEEIALDRYVGKERLSEVAEDRHESVIFVHSR